MRIGELARRSGLSADAIRFYESQQLLPPTRRSAAGYRQFGDDDLRRLNFIRRAKRLGFSLPEIGELLALSTSEDDDMGALRDSAIAAALAFLSALVALSLMMRLLRSVSFTPYVIYRVILGVVLLIIAYGG